MSVSLNKPELVTLKPADSSWLEVLHASSFDSVQRWSASLFSSMLAQPATLGLALVAHNQPLGFIFGRHIVDESEILTLMVAPEQRGKGLGHMLVAGLEKTYAAEKVQKVFLEVAVTNEAAIALYQKMGYKLVSTRPHYYEMPPGHVPAWVDGMVMAKNITG